MLKRFKKRYFKCYDEYAYDYENIFNFRCYSLEIMLHQLSTEVADLYKQETWSSEPMGDHGFVTPLVKLYKVIHITKTIIC